MQVEIDEYRDYDKALGALKESRKFMLKAEQDCTLLDRVPSPPTCISI